MKYTTIVLLILAAALLPATRAHAGGCQGVDCTPSEYLTPEQITANVPAMNSSPVGWTYCTQACGLALAVPVALLAVVIVTVAVAAVYWHDYYVSTWTPQPVSVPQVTLSEEDAATEVERNRLEAERIKAAYNGFVEQDLAPGSVGYN